MKSSLLLLLFLPLLLSLPYVNIFDAYSITPALLIELRNGELRKVNAYRSMHGVGPLCINSSLNEVAQNYSKYLFDNDVFNHSSAAYGGRYGENLFRRGSLPYMSYYEGDATAMWEEEEKNYNYQTHKSNDPNDPSKIVGHFTTQIWKGVESVGFGFTAGPRTRDVNGQGTTIV